MKCPNCGEENPEGMKFCGNCGTKLPEPMNHCPHCNKDWPLTMKFCGECGFSFGGNGAAKSAGISLGDKNVIAGDVIGSKDETHVSGNATIIKNEDETKKTATCHVCGKNVLKINGYNCPVCGQFTCTDCYDSNAGKCISCRDNAGNQKEEVYKQAVKRVLEDGKIDMGERQELGALQQQLGLTMTRALELENIVKTQINSKNTNQIGNFDRINFEKAKSVLYDELKYNEAIKLLEPLCMKYSNNEEILADYLYALSHTDPQKAKNVINSIHADILCSYLTLIDIATQANNYSQVEEYISTADKLWADEILLKCRKVDFNIKLAEYSKDKSYLSNAKEILDSCTEPKTKLERTWLLKTQENLEAVLTGNFSSLTKDDLATKNVYKGFFSCNKVFEEGDNNIKVIAIPASYGISDIKELRAKSSQVKILETITYSTAAAIGVYNKENQDAERIVLVVAIIGDSLGISVLEVGDGVYEVKSSDSSKITNSNICETIEKVIKRPIQYAGISDADLDELILCTDLPISINDIKLVNSQIKRRKVSTEAIAEGLKIQYGILTGKVKDILLLDVTPSSIIIKGSDGTYSNLLPKNTTIPTIKSTDFTLEEIKEKYTPFEIVEYHGCKLDEITENSVKTLLYKETILSDQTDDTIGMVSIVVEANMELNIAYGTGRTKADCEGLLGDNFYQNGKIKDAIYCYTTAAKRYYYGDGISKDYEKAFKWFSKAAEAGNAESQHYMGQFYYYGLTGTLNYSEALKWYTKAAEQGNPSSQYNVGYMYENGKGVTQDYNEAKKWYSKAAEWGNEQAAEALKRLT